MQERTYDRLAQKVRDNLDASVSPPGWDMLGAGGQTTLVTKVTDGIAAEYFQTEQAHERILEDSWTDLANIVHGRSVMGPTLKLHVEYSVRTALYTVGYSHMGKRLNAYKQEHAAPLKG